MLLKAVLQSIPIYYITMMQTTSIVFQDMARIMSNFFRHDKDGVLHWVNWRKCCLPYKEGVLDLGDLKTYLKPLELSYGGNFDNTIPCGIPFYHLNMLKIYALQM